MRCLAAWLAIGGASAAAAGAPQPFASSAAGSVACPAGFGRIFEETICQAAAQHLGLPFALSYSVRSFPRGCFEVGGSAYFNTHREGASHLEASAICQPSGAGLLGQDPGSEADDASCPAGQAAAAGGGCLALKAASQNASCEEKGFDPAQLTCRTCGLLAQHLSELGASMAPSEECYGCCRMEAEVERFEMARLIADASSQERDQDLHDFIKRKAPLFPRLEVEYQEGASPAIELEDSNKPDRVVRADVFGWQSDALFQFLKLRLKESGDAGKEGAAMAAQGAWTAEIQTCSG